MLFSLSLSFESWVFCSVFIFFHFSFFFCDLAVFLMWDQSLCLLLWCHAHFVTPSAGRIFCLTSGLKMPSLHSLWHLLYGTIGTSVPSLSPALTPVAAVAIVIPAGPGIHSPYCWITSRTWLFTLRTGITWEIVRNAESCALPSVPPLDYWIKIWGFICTFKFETH